MKTPRASRRGRTIRRKKLRGGAISLADMGYHLGSDVLHDFGPVYEPDLYYHFPGGLPITATETEVVNHFNGKPDIAKRLQVSTVFNVPKNTAVFSSWTAPNLHQDGNNTVGIVYDAGDKITQQLGANNVLTFGSVLDPSKKPVQPGDNPIWFDPTDKQVTIPLNMFGFDPAKIRSLKIQNFTGNATCAVFETPLGMFDAIKKPDLSSGAIAVRQGVACTPKPVNESKASQVGYFVSIKEAKVNVGILMTEKTPQRVQSAMFYLAGKTLGDTMLVASCMQQFGGNVNPFYPTRPGTWAKVGGGDGAIATPTVLILKTQDRLNHARALIMGVPSILQSRFEYTFVPGVISPKQQIEVYSKGYDNLRAELDRRYAALIEKFNAAMEGDRLKIEYGTIEGTVFIHLGKDFANEKLIAAGRIVRNIISSLETLRNHVIGTYDTEIAKIKESLAETDKIINDENAVSELQPLKTAYEAVFKKYNKCAPATRVVYEGGSGMARHIVVATKSKEIINRDIMIDLMTDFQNIRGLSKVDAIDSYVSKGTTLRSLFLEAENIRNEAERRMADAQEIVLDLVDKADKEYVENMSKNAESVIAEAPIDLENKEIKQDNDGSLVNEFVEYAKFSIDIGKLEGAPNVIDKQLRDELVDEYKYIVANNSEPNQTGGAKSDKPNQITMLFNAFVCHLNAENLRLNSEDDELYTYFHNLETRFILEYDKYTGNSDEDLEADVSAPSSDETFGTLPYGDRDVYSQEVNGSSNAAASSIFGTPTRKPRTPVPPALPVPPAPPLQGKRGLKRTAEGTAPGDPGAGPEDEGGGPGVGSSPSWLQKLWSQTTWKRKGGKTRRRRRTLRKNRKDKGML